MRRFKYLSTSERSRMWFLGRVGFSRRKRIFSVSSKRERERSLSPFPTIIMHTFVFISLPLLSDYTHESGKGKIFRLKEVRSEISLPWGTRMEKFFYHFTHSLFYRVENVFKFHHHFSNYLFIIEATIWLCTISSLSLAKRSKLLPRKWLDAAYGIWQGFYNAEKKRARSPSLPPSELNPWNYYI
jgi:hypothetical protein